jgi:hypothetical protein
VGVRGFSVDSSGIALKDFARYAPVAHDLRQMSRSSFADVLRMIAELRPPHIAVDSVSRSYVPRSLDLIGEVRLDDGKFGALTPHRAPTRSNVIDF